MASPNDLIQNVYNYFLEVYRQAVPGTPGGELVAFEPLGFTPGCSNFTGNNIASDAIAEVSKFTDMLPHVDGGIYTRTMQTISVTYCTLLDGAQPSSRASMATFSDLQTHAQEAYKNVVLGYNIGLAVQYHPTYATPIDWYDLTNVANWTKYSYDASAETPAPAPSPAPPAVVAPGVRMQWHILPPEMRQPILQRPSNVSPSPPQMVTRPRMMENAMRQPIPSRISPSMAMPVRMPPNAAIAANIAPVPAAPTEQLPGRTVMPIHITALASVTRITEQTTPQPVETPKFTMSFDYCVVRLWRPWLSGDFLATPGWYVAGVRAGDYAMGGPAGTGSFPVVQTAFIAIKNLVIDAAWSESDAAARKDAAGFGPFSLLGGSTHDKNATRNPGLQIIAWICSPLSHLPPDTDPSLATSAVTTSLNTPTSPDSGSATQPTGGSSDTPAGNSTAGPDTKTASSGNSADAGSSGAAAANSGTPADSNTPGGGSGSQGAPPSA